MWGEGVRNAIARGVFGCTRGTIMTKQPLQGVPKNDDGAKEKDGESGGGSYPNPHDEK